MKKSVPKGTLFYLRRENFYDKITTEKKEVR